ncbi:MAG: DNA double-strand break repair nuclease NurA [Chloroflexota bacterium]
MTLEFEKLTEDVEQMAETAARQQKALQARASQTLEGLHAGYDGLGRSRCAGGTLWRRLRLKFYRPARPIDQDEPLNAVIPPPPPPDIATIIATDGSQILPDRHGAFMYALINVGAMIYHHGEDHEPNIVGRPTLYFPTDEELGDGDQEIDAGRITVKRDLSEIGLVADLLEEDPDLVQPALGLLDQRLLYWPYGQRRDADKVSYKWVNEMSRIRLSGALLAGYIDRPGKRSVVSLLLGLETPTVEGIKRLDRPGMDMADIDLFSKLLGPGERSRVFAEMSPVNRRFVLQDPDNEVCFFYFNPTNTRPEDAMGGSAALARVDIPMWVARDPVAVAVVHGLINSQCQILADYPYALARADEIAVVGRHDESELDMMIDLAMQRHGIHDYGTNKLLSKSLARGGRSRMKGL